MRSKAKVMALYGALQALEWLVVEAQVAVSGPAPMGDPALHEFLLKLQLGLSRAQGRCLLHVEGPSIARAA
jgi:hypothetical protein